MPRTKDDVLTRLDGLRAYCALLVDAAEEARAEVAATAEHLAAPPSEVGARALELALADLARLHEHLRACCLALDDLQHLRPRVTGRGRGAGEPAGAPAGAGSLT